MLKPFLVDSLWCHSLHGALLMMALFLLSMERPALYISFFYFTPLRSVNNNRTSNDWNVWFFFSLTLLYFSSLSLFSSSSSFLTFTFALASEFAKYFCQQFILLLTTMHSNIPIFFLCLLIYKTLDFISWHLQLFTLEYWQEILYF